MNKKEGASCITTHLHYYHQEYVAEKNLILQ